MTRWCGNPLCRREIPTTDGRLTLVHSEEPAGREINVCSWECLRQLGALMRTRQLEQESPGTLEGVPS